MRILKISGSVLAVLLISLLVFFTYQFWPRTVETLADINAKIPAPTTSTGVRISAFSTGYNESPEAVIYSGGNVFETHKSVYSGFIIEHPKATILLEGGVGENIGAEHAANFNAFERQLFAYTKTQTARERMIGASYDPSKIDRVLLTHLHWDHGAVIPDFDGVPIMTTTAELAFARAEAPTNFSIFEEHLNRKNTNWQPFDLSDAPYGPFKQSFDMFLDGSIVAVPLGGHTNGSIGVFVTTDQGQRYFFIGDASWSLDAVKNANPKIPLVQGLVDHDKTQTELTLALLHEVYKDNPEIQFVPTHDGPIVDLLAHFPKFE
jgi:glyoxylase-like metal-dependent hydrolase (beta-lactamase superfamily II)